MIDTIILADGYEVTQFLAPAVLGYVAYWMSKEMAVLNNPMHTIVPLLVFCVIVIAISMANTDQLKQWDDIASELKYEKRNSNNICLFSFAILGGGFIGMGQAWDKQKQQKHEPEQRKKEATKKMTQKRFVTSCRWCNKKFEIDETEVGADLLCPSCAQRTSIHPEKQSEKD